MQHTHHKKQTNLSRLGLIFAIVGVLLALIPLLDFLTLPISVIAIVLSLLAFSSKSLQKTEAIAGLVGGVVALMLSIWMIATYAHNFDSGTTSVVNTASSPEPESTAPTRSTVAHTGESVTIGDDSNISVTLTSISDPAQGSDEYMTPAAGNKFVAINLTITNNGASSYSDDANNDTSVVGSDNQTYTADLHSVAGCTDFANGQVTLSAGSSVSGCITVQLPAGVSVSRIQYTTDSGFSGNTAEWQNI